jgi:hypothetical protein
MGQLIKIPILQIKKLSLRNVKELAQGGPATLFVGPSAKWK